MTTLTGPVQVCCEIRPITPLNIEHFGLFRESYFCRRKDGIPHDKIFSGIGISAIGV